jgi:hypothetical protein
MVIKEAIEIFREDTSIETFKKEIELLKSAGYKTSKETDDYVCFGQSTTVVDSDLLINKKIPQKRNPH